MTYAFTARRRRWGDNDKHFGPFTFAFRETWRPIAMKLCSGSKEHDDPGCCFRIQAFGMTLICELPPIIKPWRYWQSTATPNRFRYPMRMDGDGYWDEHPREYGFTLNDGHLYIALGAQTMDSSSTQSWSCFLPWTQWRHVRHSYYGLWGEHFADAPHNWHALGYAGRPTYDEFKAVEDSVPTRTFPFEDFDGEHLTVTTRIEEREWRFGTGYFKWLSLFRRPKVSRSLDLRFSGEVGREKGSWKGGTIGHSIEMLPDELHEAAFRRYCDQEHRSKSGPYRIKFLEPIK